MTVSELIALLQAMPQDAVVVLKGNEGGYDDIDDIKALELALNPVITKVEIEEDEFGNDLYWETGVYEEPAIILQYEKLKSIPFNAVYIKKYESKSKHSLKHDQFMRNTIIATTEEIIDFAKEQYIKTFNCSVKPGIYSYKLLCELMKKYKYWSMVKASFCCIGIEEECWNDLYCAGN